MLRSRVFLMALAFAALSSVAAAATAPVIVTPETAKWQPAPGFKGFQMATIVGDPSKAGAYYAYFLKFPAGGKAPPHFHGMTENVVVISGTVMFGFGDTMNVAKMMTLRARHRRFGSRRRAPLRDGKRTGSGRDQRHRPRHDDAGP